LGREIVRISLIVRNLGLTNCERQRLVDRVNRTVDIMRSLDCHVSDLGKKIANTRSESLKRDYRKEQRQYRGDLGNRAPRKFDSWASRMTDLVDYEQCMPGSLVRSDAERIA